MNVNYNTGHALKEDSTAHKICHGIVVSDFIELGVLNSLCGKINTNVVGKIYPHIEKAALKWEQWGLCTYSAQIEFEFEPQVALCYSAA